MNDSDTSETLTKILMLVLAAAVLPTLIPTVRDKIVASLLSYDVLVPASRAAFEIPTTGAGLDIRRILIIAFALLLAGLIHQMGTRTHRKAKR